MQSCLFEQEDLFDKSVSERLNDYIESFHEILVSADNGWVLEYYPEENQSYGGYVYTFDFTTDEVIVKSEFPDMPAEGAMSYYKFTTDDGPVLTFDTYNEVFHYFATPYASGIPGLNGTYEALHGDYEFNILGKNEDASEIYLTGKKTGNKMTLRKLPASYNTVDEYLEAVMKVQTAVKSSSNNFYCGSIEGIAIMANNVLQISYEIPDVTAQASEGAANAEPAMKTISVKVPFTYTANGINFYQEVEFEGFEGKTYSSLYADENDELVSEDGLVRVAAVVTPLNQLFVDMASWSVTYSAMSPAMKAIMDPLSANLLSGEGERIAYWYLGYGSDLNSAFQNTFELFIYMDTGYRAEVGLNVEFDGDKIVFSASGKNGGDAVWYANNYNFDTIYNFYGYSAPKTYVLSADNKKSPSYIRFTDESNEDIYFDVYPGLLDY